MTDFSEDSTGELVKANTDNIFEQLLAQQCSCKLRLLFARKVSPLGTTNFHVAKSRSDVYFLHHENLYARRW